MGLSVTPPFIRIVPGVNRHDIIHSGLMAMMDIFEGAALTYVNQELIFSVPRGFTAEGVVDVLIEADCLKSGEDRFKCGSAPWQILTHEL